ncbi:MAG TPA: hypothetical protein PK280_03945 [Planctomycetota bacterium]|nr:hypothetical protein [Planctomycetota bacterium]
MPNDFKLLQAALRMALRDPHSVGQKGLSIVLGAGQLPRPSERFVRLPRPRRTA